MTHNVQDHPIVCNMERTGQPDGKEPHCPRCPICEAEADAFYKTTVGEIVGCDNCVRSVDAWDEPPNIEGSYHYD